MSLFRCCCPKVRKYSLNQMRLLLTSKFYVIYGGVSNNWATGSNEIFQGGSTKPHLKASIQMLITCKGISYFLTGIQKPLLDKTSSFAFRACSYVICGAMEAATIRYGHNSLFPRQINKTLASGPNKRWIKSSNQLAILASSQCDEPLSVSCGSSCAINICQRNRSHR